MPSIALETVLIIQKLREEGYSLRGIQRIVGYIVSGIKNVLYLDPQTRKVRGSERKTTPQEDLELVNLVKANSINRRLTLNELRNQWKLHSKLGHTPSSSTTMRRLHEHNMASRKPRQVICLREQNRIKRLAWVAKYSNWTIKDWKQVQFTDESFFVNEHDIRVWRHPDERMHPDCTGTNRRSSRYRINFWADVSWNQRTALEFFDTFNTEVFISILQRYDTNLTWQFDNHPSHVSKKSKAFFQSRRIKSIDWPPQSPDLNPIENLWSILKRKIKKGDYTNKDKMKSLLVDAWNTIPQQVIRNLITTLPQRIKKVVENNGGMIDY